MAVDRLSLVPGGFELFVLFHPKLNFVLSNIQYNRNFAIKFNRTKTLSILLFEFVPDSSEVSGANGAVMEEN